MVDPARQQAVELSARLPASRRLREPLSSMTRRNLGEAALVLSLLVLCVYVRLLRLQPIELYDDEVTRWAFVRQWFHENSFREATWTHHMARFGVNVPLFVVQGLFGRQATAYYVWPIASFALQVLLTHAVAKRLAGHAAALCAALLLTVFTGLDRGASQILPDAFGGTAMVLVLYLLMRYHDAPFERRTPWLWASSLALVWAYEIKESNLLFVPGLLLAVWQLRGRRFDALLPAVVLAGAIALETLLYRSLTAYPSRFAIVGEAHGIVHSTFWGLFERFTRLEPPWQMLMWTWLASALSLAAASDRRLGALLLLPAGFVLLLTFLVRSLDPLVLWTNQYSRYFEPAAPLMVIAVACFATSAVRNAWTRLAGERLRQVSARLARHHLLVGLGACLCVFALEYTAVDDFFEPALSETRRIARLTNDAFGRNLPIVVERAAPGTTEERRARPLKLIYGVYLDDRAISSSPLATRGRLPDALEVLRESERYTYLLREPNVYAQRQIDAYVAEGCALVVGEAFGHGRAAAGVPSLMLSRTRVLPARCLASKP